MTKVKKIIKINLSEDKYDSHKAFDIYDVSELISTLIEYHKGLCECIGACTSPILKQYNIWYKGIRSRDNYTNNIHRYDWDFN